VAANLASSWSHHLKKNTEKGLVSIPVSQGNKEIVLDTYNTMLAIALAGSFLAAFDPNEKSSTSIALAGASVLKKRSINPSIAVARLEKNPWLN
jgi:hypothetical protein